MYKRRQKENEEDGESTSLGEHGFRLARKERQMTDRRNGKGQMTDLEWMPGDMTAQDMTDKIWQDDTNHSGAGPWIGEMREGIEVDPETPTTAAPGSMEKVMMLQARYAAGVPLWDDRDSYDHSKAAAMVGAAGRLMPAAEVSGEDVFEEHGEPLAI